MDIKKYLDTDINNKKAILEHIEKLETELAICEHKLADNNKPCMSLNYLRVCKLYKPEIKYVQSEKCNKCNSDRLIPIDNSFSLRYNVCSCKKYRPVYTVKELIVRCMSFDTKTNIASYDCFDGRYYISITSEFIYSSFSEEHLNTVCSNVFYTNPESCELYCRRKNK